MSIPLSLQCFLISISIILAMLRCSLLAAILIPSFMTSELKTAFTIGFIIYIPFVIIDLIVASVLMSMGMMMLSPMMISMPFKLMLFVLADGWILIMQSLTSSFAL